MWEENRLQIFWLQPIYIVCQGVNLESPVIWTPADPVLCWHRFSFTQHLCRATYTATYFHGASRLDQSHLTFLCFIFHFTLKFMERKCCEPQLHNSATWWPGKEKHIWRHETKRKKNCFPSHLKILFGKNKQTKKVKKITSSTSTFYLFFLSRLCNF